VAGVAPSKNGRSWRNLHLQQKTAFSRFSPVHRTDLEGRNGRIPAVPGQIRKVGKGTLSGPQVRHRRRSNCAKICRSPTNFGHGGALSQKNMRIVQDAASIRQDRREQSLEIEFDLNN
jgi:hypothetical protein